MRSPQAVIKTWATERGDRLRRCGTTDMGTFSRCDHPYNTRFRPERVLDDQLPGGIGLAAQVGRSPLGGQSSSCAPNLLLRLSNLCLWLSLEHVDPLTRGRDPELLGHSAPAGNVHLAERALPAPPRFAGHAAVHCADAARVCARGRVRLRRWRYESIERAATEMLGSRADEGVADIWLQEGLTSCRFADATKSLVPHDSIASHGDLCLRYE